MIVAETFVVAVVAAAAVAAAADFGFDTYFRPIDYTAYLMLAGDFQHQFLPCSLIVAAVIDCFRKYYYHTPVAAVNSAVAQLAMIAATLDSFVACRSWNRAAAVENID